MTDRDEARRSSTRWDEGTIYVMWMSFGGAAELLLDIVEGTIGVGPVAGGQISQIGVVLGGATFGAIVTSLVRKFLQKD